MIKNNLLFCIYLLFVVLLSIYILLDTFVTEEVYTRVKKNLSEQTANNAIVTSNSYNDDNISIAIKKYDYNNTFVYVGDIILNDSKYLKTAFAKSSYGKNVTDYTSSIATNVNAILAINGDYYGVQENGYVLKNGIVYRNTVKKNQQDLVIYNNGTWQIINEFDISLAELVGAGAYNILSFGPSLVKNGKIMVEESSEVDKSMTSNPRTAIGKISDNHYIFLVSDGRTKESQGLSLYELATFLKDLGCTTAYNLDGGGSSTFVFNGKVINNPTTTGKTIHERKVSDIVYIGY